jgi:hypothetical protein
MTLLLDSTRKVKDTFNIATPNHPYLYIYQTSVVQANFIAEKYVYVKNSVTNKVCSLAFRELLYSRLLKNCFVCLVENLKGRRELVIFDFNKSSLTHYNIYADAPIGYDDTCVYFEVIKFKHKKKAYKYGTIVSFNEKGVNTIKPSPDKQTLFSSKLLFYSKTYQVTDSFLYTEMRDCRYEEHTLVKVYYLNQLIDSIETVHNTGRGYSFEAKGDAFTCVLPDGSILKYSGYKLITKWLTTLWLKEFTFLRGDNEYSYHGDSILIRVEFYKSFKSGYVLHGEDSVSLNGVILNKSRSRYSLVLAFDIKRNIFLGYPRIEFVNSGKYISPELKGSK